MCKEVPICPDCKASLEFIINSRMDFKTEKIPVCNKCNTAHRDPKLGWEIIDSEEDE